MALKKADRHFHVLEHFAKSVGSNIVFGLIDEFIDYIS